ncbi:MAG: cobaltochelatase subunit CobN [Acidobacteria bacterium]|nr:cobaltochelatase subunit CobN [Acidobacteriota bacterium]
MKVTVCYVGSSLLAPLRQAERDVARLHGVELRVGAYNFGAPLNEDEWESVERDLAESSVVFVLHVTDGANGARLIPLLERYEARLGAVVVINCMPDLMRRTRMGRLRFGKSGHANAGGEAVEAGESGEGAEAREGRARRLVKSVGGWMAGQARGRGKSGSNHTQYLRYVERLPALLRLVPSAGRLGDFKHYLQLFCYFLQPTPANVRSLLVYALKHYAHDPRLARAAVAPPETMPAVAIYHPDAPALFETFDKYRAWHDARARRRNLAPLDPERTVGLLLMRPQIVSRTTKHYDGLIRAVEAEGLAVLPAISTFMDNREACEKFFVEKRPSSVVRDQNRPLSVVRGQLHKTDTHRAEREVITTDDGRRTTDDGQLLTDKPRVSQIVSLTGFSFVGGPAMNDSEAAVEFFRELGVPYRSAVSLDVQSVEAWRESWTGLNPVQAGMQVAIPEIDGAIEPFVFGGISAEASEPVPLADRCQRLARRLKRWQRLQTAPRAEVKLALVVFCFPPDKGNVGTAAELDVFESAWEMLRRLEQEGYAVEVPRDAHDLRERLLRDEEGYGTAARVEYRMSVDEYRALCPHVAEIEKDWGRAPGEINSFGGTLLVQGLRLGNVFVGVQPSFGYEGDPVRLMMSRAGAPHHGFSAFYAFAEKVFGADAVVHVGTHGALEFMPGKQLGMSGDCWSDRLIGELPHLYAYSVNNPSEGSIARRRSYAELISYLTPPVEDAGVYRDLASLKELLQAYRQTGDAGEREQLFDAIEAKAGALHFD